MTRAVSSLLALAALAAALVSSPASAAARYAVGAAEVGDLPRLKRQLGGRAESLAPLPVLVVERRVPPLLRDLPDATYVERLGRRRLAFVPEDPLAARQWHLPVNRAFDFWQTPPLLLPPVRVAVIDSGVDRTHPEFVGKVADGKSFVGGSPYVDRQGHGTFVAGLIAAAIGNAEGGAGMAPSAELLVAKVVQPDLSIDVLAEAKAIRWAVDRGARVINISLGGLRDPQDPSRDTFSHVEAAAISYAHERGVVVVAAVGNSDAAPRQPWPYASYPAALPHVLGVSALARDGSAPPFSNRDKIYNDIAAPGQAIISTLPKALTAPFKDCLEQGYSTCGPDEYRTAVGTSFAAPQVSAAAAVLLAERPSLQPEQVTALLTQTAVDMKAATGCRVCPPQRDELTGWGRLDVTAAVQQLEGQVPPPDRFEPNDDAGPEATRLCCPTKRLVATLDFWDDQNDVYAIKLRRRQPVYVSVRGPAGTDTNLILWKPGTKRVDDLRAIDRIGAQSAHPGPRENLSYRATRTGWHFVQVKLGSRGAGRYKLVIVKA
jgi:Subtilase family